MRAPDFWRHRGIAAALLAPLGALYGASVAFKARNAKPVRSSAKVICVGNLTAGGSGKTPVAIAVAQALLARGKKTFFLTRGFGGRVSGPIAVRAAHSAAQVGDEALLLARIAPTIVAADRAAGAALAVAQGAECIVMDDGHQNFTLAKDLSLVVVDAESGFGNGLMIPAGPLRETVAQGLARADAVVLVGSEGFEGGPAPRTAKDGRTPKRAPEGTPDLQNYAGPLLRARLMPQGDDFRGRHVFAFVGIGRPEKFIASLQEAGAIIIGTQFFADHHAFQSGEIAALKARAVGTQLITTEKDFVRLSASEAENVAVLKVAAVFDDCIGPLLDRLSR